MNELELKNTEKKKRYFTMFFFVFLCSYLSDILKNFLKRVKTASYCHIFSKLYEQLHALKLLKMPFFCLNSWTNEKNSNKFFFFFFLVAHIFLKTNDTVRKNGYFDSLWEVSRDVCIDISMQVLQSLEYFHSQNK